MTTDVGKRIRAELKATFPRTKFRVTDGHHSTSVAWTDGPTVADVESALGCFHATYFDLTLYDLFASTCLFLHRKQSMSLMAKAVRRIAERYGVPPAKVTAEFTGGYIASEDNYAVESAGGEHFSTLVWREVNTLRGE